MDLCCEFSKDLEWRAIVIDELALADHIGDLNARNCGGRRMSCLEPIIGRVRRLMKR